MDNSELYDWKRYWIPINKEEARISLTEDGFLRPPTEFYNNHLRTLEELENKDYLILIGEPGIGKSKVLEHLKQQKRQRQDYIFKNLTAIDGNKLEKFFHTKVIPKLNKTKGDLYVYLDSLDECRLVFIEAATYLTNLLKEELKNFKDRLKLRITCRAKDLPETIKQGLKSFYNQEEDNCFKLQPLTKENIITASKQNDIDSEHFIEEIIKKQVVSLAIKPITLRFLVNLYRENNGFPNKIVELYEKGLKLLSIEDNSFYKELKIIGKLNPEDRLLIAARIAAISKFCNFTTIAKSKDDNHLKECITFEKIKEGFTQEQELDINDGNIEEVLGSSLFSSYNNTLMCWSHQSYAEFLAAYYLHCNYISQEKSQGLFFQNSFSKKAVYSQLSEVAYWYSLYNEVFLEEILNNDYHVFLNRHSNHLSKDQKKTLLTFFKKSLNKGTVYYNWRDSFKGLVYDGIEDEILSILDQKDTSLKYYFIQLAHYCSKDIRVKNCMLKVALNSNESIDIRVEALRYLEPYGDDETIRQLVPLLNSDKAFENDTKDKLKGTLLSILYPDFTSTKDILHHLRNPKKDNFVGIYHSFWQHDFMEVLSNRVDDLCYVMNYAVELEYNDFSFFERFCQAIIELGYKEINNNQIRTTFFDAIITLITKKSHYNITQFFPYSLNKTKNFIETKKIFIKQVINRIKNKDVINLKIDIFCYGHNERILYKKDLSWIFEEISLMQDEEEQYYWTELIYILTDSQFYENSRLKEFLKELYDIYHKFKIQPFQEKYKEIFGGIELNSQRAEELKQVHLGEIRWQEYNEKLDRDIAIRNKKIDKNKKNIILELTRSLNDCNNVSVWRDIARFILLEAKGNEKCHISTSLDLTNQKNWEILTSAQKEQALQAAQAYLEFFNLKCECTWHCRSLHYGYLAINLLYELTPNYLENHIELYEKWARAILYLNYGDRQNQDNYIKTLFIFSPKKTIECIIKRFNFLLDNENKSYYYNSFFYRIEHISHEKLNNYYFSILNIVDDELYILILNKLIQENHSKILEYGENVLQSKLTPEIYIKNAMTLILILNYNSKYFTKIFDLLKENIEFLDVFIKIISGSFAGNRDKNKSKLLDSLNDNELTEWYIFLHNNYPIVSRYERIDDSEELHRDNENESISDYQQLILNSLHKRNTPNIVSCFEKINKSVDKEFSLTIDNLKKNIKFNNWYPLQPKEFLSIVKEDKIPIHSEEQLLNLVYKTLEQFQKNLKEEDGLVLIESLWEEQKIIERKDEMIKISSEKKNKIKDNYHPKSENKITNIVAQYLKQELKVIVNREVQINSKGQDKGDSTDIKIEAQNENNVLTVIIEAKGSWNKKLKVAMKNQLVQQYLDNHTCNSGIYLIYYILDNSRLDKESSYYKNTLKTKEFRNLKGYRKYYENQAEKIAQKTNKNIKSFVLDCTFEQKSK